MENCRGVVVARGTVRNRLRYDLNDHSAQARVGSPSRAAEGFQHLERSLPSLFERVTAVMQRGFYSIFLLGHGELRRLLTVSRSKRSTCSQQVQTK